MRKQSAKLHFNIKKLLGSFAFIELFIIKEKPFILNVKVFR